MKEEEIKKERQLRRQKRARIRALKVSKAGLMPRLTVFRSNKYLYAQIIDDSKGSTLVSAYEKEVKGEKEITRSQKAIQLGKTIAMKAKEKGIKKVVFDKGSYKFHGRIKNFVDASREEGLIF